MLVPRMVTGCVCHHLAFLMDGNLGAAANELQTDEENPLLRHSPHLPPDWEKDKHSNYTK